MYLALRTALVALVAVALVGCATSTAIQLKPEASARIQSTRAQIIIPQEEINATVAGTGGAGAAAGGLIGALIDASVEAKRAGNANLVIEPVRKHLADFDFRAEFSKKMRAALVDMSWLKVDQVEVTSQPYGSADDRNKMRASIPQDSLLVMSVAYQLSVDYRSLIVYGSATLWQRNREEAQYFGQYRYLSAPIKPKKGETVAQAWANNNAELLRAAIHEGIGETIRMLKIDFVPKAVAEQEDVPLGEDGKLKVVSIKMPAGIYKGGVTTSRLNELAGKILAKDGDRIIFRSKFAERYTYPGHIYSTTTRGHFGVPAAVSPAPPGGEARP